MQRAIIDYAQDDEGDWTAILDCAHRQHVRHRPPFVSRPWVTSASGRASKLGEPLECVRCDRFEWPEGIEIHKRTPVFDQHSAPRGLQADHRTRAGVWGRIVVEQGLLRYHVDVMDVHRDLAPGTPGVIVPQLSHRVELAGEVRFCVEFHARKKVSDLFSP